MVAVCDTTYTALFNHGQSSLLDNRASKCTIDAFISLCSYQVLLDPTPSSPLFPLPLPLPLLDPMTSTIASVISSIGPIAGSTRATSNARSVWEVWVVAAVAVAVACVRHSTVGDRCLFAIIVRINPHMPLVLGGLRLPPLRLPLPSELRDS